MDERHVCYRRPGLLLVAVILAAALLPAAEVPALSKSSHSSSKKSGSSKAASSAGTSHSRSKKRKHGSAVASSSEKSTSKKSKGSKHKGKGHGRETEEASAGKTGSKSKVSSKHKSQHEDKVVHGEDYYEPKLMPPNYEAETRLLAKAYSLRDLALNEQMRGDLGDAVKHLSEAAEISAEYYQGKPSPAEAQLYLDLAVAAESAGQNDLARKSYEDSLARNPKLADVRVKLATLLTKMGDFDQAMVEARRAAQADTSDPRPHHLLAILLERKGDLAGAEEERSRTKALLGAKPQRKPEPQKQQPEAEKKPEEGEPGESEPEEKPPDDMPLGLP